MSVGLQILSEAATDSGGMAIPAAVGAGVVVAFKAMELVGRQVWRRNGGCNDKPGYTPACVGHLERLKAQEVELTHLREGQRRIEKKLDRVLEKG